MPNDSGAPRPQYTDDLIVNHPELGEVEVWKVMAWNMAKQRNAMIRADSASDVDAGTGPKKPPPLVADAIQKAETDLMLKVKDCLDRLDSRMTALEKKADEEDRVRAAEEALELTETLAEIAPKELLTALADRIIPDRRLH